MIKANEKKNYNKLKTYALDEKKSLLIGFIFSFLRTILEIISDL